MKQSDLKSNQKLLIDAFKNQNDETYDQALQYFLIYQFYRKLQLVGDNLIRMIQKIQYNSQFYMKHMPLMKDQRELVSQKDYKQFMSKNQKILSRNFEKNAYLALLMQQMQQKQKNMNKNTVYKKWTNKQQQLFQKLVNVDNLTVKQCYNKFNRHTKQQIQEKYYQSKEKDKINAEKNNNLLKNNDEGDKVKNKMKVQVNEKRQGIQEEQPYQ